MAIFFAGRHNSGLVFSLTFTYFGTPMLTWWRQCSGTKTLHCSREISNYKSLHQVAILLSDSVAASTLWRGGDRFHCPAQGRPGSSGPADLMRLCEKDRIEVILSNWLVIRQADLTMLFLVYPLSYMPDWQRGGGGGGSLEVFLKQKLTNEEEESREWTD